MAFLLWLLAPTGRMGHAHHLPCSLSSAWQDNLEQGFVSSLACSVQSVNSPQSCVLAGTLLFTPLSPCLFYKAAVILLNEFRNTHRNVLFLLTWLWKFIDPGHPWEGQVLQRESCHSCVFFLSCMGVCLKRRNWKWVSLCYEPLQGAFIHKERMRDSGHKTEVSSTCQGTGTQKQLSLITVYQWHHGLKLELLKIIPVF